MRVLRNGCVAAIGVVMAGLSTAAPLEISEDGFRNNFLNQHLLSEDFHNYPIGLQPSPFVMGNGTYIGNGSVDQAPWCTVQGADRCLDTQIADGTFQAFPAGTTTWTARVYFSGEPQGVIANVVGNSGSLQVEFQADVGTSNGQFVGFYDPEGLQSIAFHIDSNEAGGPGFGFNYGFDTVTTSASTPISGGSTLAAPLPTLGDDATALLAAAMSAAGLLALRRKLA